MKGYIIHYRYQGIDNYPCHKSLDGYGIFLNKPTAQIKVNELNKPGRIAWEQRIKCEKKKIKREQLCWDALNAAGLADYSRPEFNSLERNCYPYEEKYFFEEIEIHEN